MMWNWFLSHFSYEHQQEIKTDLFLGKFVIVIGFWMFVAFAFIYWLHNN